MKEPEVIIEAKLTALLAAAVPALDVVGALELCEPGDMKIAAHSNVSVVVDLASQDIDFAGPNIPCSYSVRVGVNVTFDVDKDGSIFRDATRSVRAALSTLMGDRCAALDGDGFSCDAFVMGPTQTSIAAADGSGAMSKNYTATLVGRYTPQTQEDE